MMVRTDGCIGALIMGMDGIPVEEIWNPIAQDMNFDIAVAEFSSVVKNVCRLNNSIGLGKLNELTLSTENGIFIFRIVSKDYFLAMILCPEGNLGRGRYELRRAELLLEKELVF